MTSLNDHHDNSSSADLSTNEDNNAATHAGGTTNSGFESSDGYWAKRKKNNEAARRSREKRRLNDMMMEKRMMQLTEENKKLKTQLWTIQIKYGETQESATYTNPSVQYSTDPPSTQPSKPGGFTSKFFTNSCGDTSAKVIIKTPAGPRDHGAAKKHSYQQPVTGDNTTQHIGDRPNMSTMCNPLTEMTHKSSSNMILPTSSPHHPPSPSENHPHQAVSNNSGGGGEMKTYQSMMSNPELLQHLHVGGLYPNPFNYQALMSGFIQSASCPDIPHFVHHTIPSMYPLDLRQQREDVTSGGHEPETKRRRRSTHHPNTGGATLRYQPPPPPQSHHYDVMSAAARSNGFRSGSDSSVTTSPRNSPLSDVVSNAGSDGGSKEPGCHLPLKLRFKRKPTDGNGSQ